MKSDQAVAKANALGAWVKLHMAASVIIARWHRDRPGGHAQRGGGARRCIRSAPQARMLGWLVLLARHRRTGAKAPGDPGTSAPAGSQTAPRNRKTKSRPEAANKIGSQTAPKRAFRPVSYNPEKGL
jgi:hypothetical protein